MNVRPHLHADQTSADSRRPKKSAGGAVRVKLKPMKGLPLDVDNTEVTSSRSRPSSSPSLQDRLSMLVTEANEISKYLQRDYSFIKLGDATDDEPTAKVIKVTNKRLDMSCVWSVAKLKERLVRMRKLVYAKDDSLGSVGMEAVFFDPSDEWQKDGQEATAIDASPATPAFEQDNPLARTALQSYDQPSQAYKPNTALTSAFKPLQRSQQAPPSSPPAPPPAPPTSMDRALTPVSQTGDTSLSLLGGDGRSVNGELTPAGGVEELATETSFLRLSSSWPAGPDDDTISVASAAPSTAAASTRTSRNHGNGVARSEPSKSDVISTFVPDISKPRAINHRRRCHRRSQTSPSLLPAVVASSDGATGQLPELAACRLIIEHSSRQLQDIEQQHYKPADIVLASCEYLKLALVSVLEIYVQTHETPSVQAAPVESGRLLQQTCCEVAATVCVLRTVLCSWCDVLAGLQSSPLNTLCGRLLTQASLLGQQVALFLQKYEQSNDVAVSESGAQVIEAMFELLRCTGRLCLATETLPQLLSTPSTDLDIIRAVVNGDKPPHIDRVLHMPGDDIRQSLLDGCDQGLGQTFQDALTFFMDFEDMLQRLIRRRPQSASVQQVDEKIFSMIQSAVQAGRSLVEVCRQQQVSLNAEMTDENKPKPRQFFENYFGQCKQMNVNINALVDFASLQREALQGLTDSRDAGSLSKVCRCSEMLQKTVATFLEISDKDIMWYLVQSKNVTSSVAIERPSSARMSAPHLASHRSPVARAAHEVIGILDVLVANLRERLVLDGVDAAGSKVRRLLPITPGRGRPMVRAQSAKGLDRLRAIHASVAIGNV